MLVLSERQRALFADKLLDLANLAMSVGVFGQALSDRPFSIVLMLVGFGFWIGLMYFAGRLIERNGNDG